MIEKSKNIQKFEEALNADENLRNKYKAALKKIADERSAKSDGEAMVKAAAQLGFEINIDEMERAFAATQELDDDELANVAAGVDEGNTPKCLDNIGIADKSRDEYGHEGLCFAAWHCATAFLHTESESKRVLCWKNYLCEFINK